MKKQWTLSDEESFAKFDLKQLSKGYRSNIEALILRFRQIWSEHSFDLGLHKFVKHDIVLRGAMPKQRFWPAIKREAAEELISNFIEIQDSGEVHL